jgi:hypothetical protein
MLFRSIQPIALPTQSYIPRIRSRTDFLLRCLDWDVPNRAIRPDAILLDGLLLDLPPLGLWRLYSGSLQPDNVGYWGRTSSSTTCISCRWKAAQV